MNPFANHDPRLNKMSEKMTTKDLEVNFFQQLCTYANCPICDFDTGFEGDYERVMEILVNHMEYAHGVEFDF
jgi:hypothetical protein